MHGKGPCDTFLGGTVSLRKSLCLHIPLSPCYAPAPPADPQTPLKVALKLAGRDHTVRLHGAGLPVRAAAGRVRRVLLGPGPFFGDIHPKAQAAPSLLCTGNEVAASVGGLAGGREGVALETQNVPCGLSCEFCLSADLAFISCHVFLETCGNSWVVPGKNCFNIFFS